MAKLTIFYALLLIALGVGGYFASGQASVTALIPSFIGVPILICGLIANANPASRKLTMHIAVFFAIIAIAGGSRGIPGFIDVLTGEEVERPQAAIAQGVLVILSAIYVTLGIKSFTAARKAN
jgi:hypothetical protein